MKQAGDRFNVRIERSTALKGLGPQEFKFEEDTVSLRVGQLKVTSGQPKVTSGQP